MIVVRECQEEVEEEKMPGGKQTEVLLPGAAVTLKTEDELPAAPVNSDKRWKPALSEEKFLDRPRLSFFPNQFRFIYAHFRMAKAASERHPTKYGFDSRFMKHLFQCR